MLKDIFIPGQLYSGIIPLFWTDMYASELRKFNWIIISTTFPDVVVFSSRLGLKKTSIDRLEPYVMFALWIHIS